jgi:hypothetical protein
LDDEEDYSLSMWAGILPLKLKAGTPTPDSRSAAGTALPRYLADFSDKH